MEIDLIIFSRNRNRELQRTARRLVNSGFRVLIFHNATQPLVLKESPAKVEYFFCPGMSFSERADKAKNHLKHPYSIICTDDDGVIESELNEMMNFLELNPMYESVGGCVLGTFPYGSVLTGAFAYTEMDSYENSIIDVESRIESHMLGKKTGELPRASMYRLFKREKMELLLDSFALCKNVQTPYIFEVVSEFISIWMGPTINVPHIYWIRNWKNREVNHANWDRSFDFSDWWGDENFESQRWIVIDGLAKLTGLTYSYVFSVFNQYAAARKKKEKRTIVESNALSEILRRLKQSVLQNVFPSRMPPDLKTIIVKKFPVVPESKLSEILQVAEEMF